MERRDPTVRSQNTNPSGMAVDTNGDWLVVDSNDAGIYRSTNDGATWSVEIPLPAAIANPAGMAVDTNGDWLVVDSTDDGIYRSTDDGATWSAEIPLPAAITTPTAWPSTRTVTGWWWIRHRSRGSGRRASCLFPRRFDPQEFRDSDTRGCSLVIRRDRRLSPSSFQAVVAVAGPPTS